MSTSPAPEDFVMVAITVPDIDTGGRLARLLVQEQLAACVNLLPGVRSVYAWQGQICDEAEVLCLAKTRRTLFPALRDRVLAAHPYETPEIIAFEPSMAHSAYLAWINASTRAPV